jgi:hypothetical protein
MKSTVDSLLKTKRALADKLLKPNSHSNVLGVGVNEKTNRLQVYVQNKRSYSVGQITADCASVPDISVDIIEIGRFGRLSRGPAPRKEIGPGSPIRFNTAAPNVNSRSFGTLGATVRYYDDYFILGCNHIIAANGRVPGGTEIVLGELAGAGVKPKGIATFLGEDYFVEIGRNTISRADCAVALLNKKLIPKRFPVATPIEPHIDMKVTKDGAITTVTKGRIVDTSVDVFADYSFGTFRFNNQILIQGYDDEFAWEGDSGSVVTDMEGHPVAMVFAEAGEYAVACPLSTVFKELGKLPALQGKQPVMSLRNLI